MDPPSASTAPSPSQGMSSSMAMSISESDMDASLTTNSATTGMSMGRVASGVARTELDPFARVERLYRLSNTPQEPSSSSSSSSSHSNKNHARKKARTVPVPSSIDLRRAYPNLIDFGSAQHPRIRPMSVKRSVQSPHFGDIRTIYGLEGHEGFYVIPNPFTPEQQRYWVQRCVRDLTLGNPTNVSNLDGNVSLWSQWEPSLMRSLRWASVGYHFQWTQRVYMDDERGPVPQDMNGIVRDLAALIGIDMVAEASIINFYPRENCVMGGHVDDSEEDMTKPVVSLSFGNSIVFCIGETSRDVEPSAILVNSGDIVIMSGHSRYCYHSVPRMFAHTCPTFLSEHVDTDTDKESLWAPVRAYISNARVNMNCRQVKIARATQELDNNAQASANAAHSSSAATQS